MATKKDKEWLNEDPKPSDLGKENRASLNTEKEKHLQNRVPLGSSGVQSEHSGNSPQNYHQGSSVSGQTGMHNKQQSQNISGQGMAGQSSAQAPSGHYGQDSTNQSHKQSSGGSPLNVNEVKSTYHPESDKGQGNPGIQGQYSGNDALARKTNTDDANRQRKDYADLSKKNSDLDKDDKSIDRGF